MKNLKAILVLWSLLGLLAAQAQTETTEFRIKLVDIKNGEHVEIDTTFNSHEEMEAFMEERGIKNHMKGMDMDVDINWEELHEGDSTHDGKRIIKKHIIHHNAEDVEIETLDGADMDVLLEELDAETAEKIRVQLEKHGISEGDAEVKMIFVVKKVKVEELTDDEISQAKIEPQSKLEVKSFDISPNPATDHLTIKIKSESEDPGVLRILSMEGKELYQTELKTLNAQYELPIKSLKSGMYIVHVSSADQSMSKKLIIQE